METTSLISSLTNVGISRPSIASGTSNHASVSTTSSATPSVFDAALGGVALGVFVVIWVTSVLVPFVLVYALFTQRWILAAVLILIYIVAFAPWPTDLGTVMKNTVTQFYNTYQGRYHKRYEIIFEDGDEEESAKAPAAQKCFYAIHPHGAFAFGWSRLFSSSLRTSVRFCFSPFLYYSPLFHIFCRLTGNPGKADKASMHTYMSGRSKKSNRQGGEASARSSESVALLIGGFEEATLSSMKQDRVYIKKRVGFVKLCLQHGYSIVPVFSFGEARLYWNLQGFWSCRLALSRLGVPAIFIWGLALLPFLPKRPKQGLLLVVGKPLIVPKIESPTRQEVKEWHDKYMVALVELYDRYKCEAYGYEEGRDATLELW